MSTKPGRLTLKNREGRTLLTVTPLPDAARHVLFSINNTHVALESAAAVEGLAKHLMQSAAWMRAQEKATTEVFDELRSIMDTMEIFEKRGGR